MEALNIDENIQWASGERETVITLLNKMVLHFNGELETSSRTTFFQLIAEKFEADKVQGFLNMGTLDCDLTSQDSKLQPSSLNGILQELDKNKKYNDFVLKILFVLRDQWEVEIDSSTKEIKRIKDEDSILIGLEYIRASYLMFLGEMTQAHLINRMNLVRIKGLENNSKNSRYVSVESYKGLCLLLAMKTSESIVALMNYYDQIKDMTAIMDYQGIEGDKTIKSSVQLSFLAVWVLYFQLKRLGRPDVMREMFKCKIEDNYQGCQHQRSVLRIHFLEIMGSLIFCKELQPKIQWLMEMKDLREKTSESESLSFWDDFKYELYLRVKASQTDSLNPYAGLMQILLMLQDYDQLIADSHERFKQEKYNELKEIVEEGPSIIEPAFTQKYVNLYVQKLQRQLSHTAKMKTAVGKDRKQGERNEGRTARGDDQTVNEETDNVKDLISFIPPISQEKLFMHLDVLAIAGDYHTAQQITQAHLTHHQFQHILEIFNEQNEKDEDGEDDTYKEVIPLLYPSWQIKQEYEELFTSSVHYHFLRLCKLNTLYLLYLRNHEEALDQCRIGLGLIMLSHKHSYEMLPFLRLQVKLARYVQKKDLARESLKYIDQILWLEKDEHDDDGEEEEEEEEDRNESKEENDEDNMNFN